MYRTEIHGKLPSALRSSEDILTGLVFALFHYGDRRRFLAPWLRTFDLHVTDDQSDEARFRFWPTFDDGTEPDILIDVGAYLLVIEAKLLSDFGADAEDCEQNQLPRELRGGRYEARASGRELRLMTVTAEAFPRSPRYQDLTEDDRAIWLWTSWQEITWWLERLPAEAHTHMSRDLLEVLRRRGLRHFSGFNHLRLSPRPVEAADPLFWRPPAAFARLHAMPSAVPSVPLFSRVAPRPLRNRRQP